MATKPRTSLTIAARMSALETSVATLVAALTAAQANVAPQAPVKAAAKSSSRFYNEVIVARAIGKVACEIHSAKECTRTFSPASSGRENHVPRKS
jgi:hypothetical protein